KMIEPDVGTSVPDSMLKIVLLPEPFGPIRPRISPFSTLNDTLLTAVKPPKRFTRPFTASTAAPPCYRLLAYWLLNVVPFGSGSTASRTAWLFGHTTYDLSSMYWMMTGNERWFWPAIPSPSVKNFTPKPSMVPPSGTSTSSAALRSASESMPPYFLMARGSTSVRNRYVFDAAMPTWAERMATPGLILSNSSLTILISGGSFGSMAFWLASQIEIGSV